MSNTNTQYSVSDYGSSISISRDTYINEVLDDSVVIFATDADKFLPDYSEFYLEWNSSDYIDEYLSFFEFDNINDEEFVKNSLWNSKLRYMAEDSFSEWEEETI